MNARIRPAIDSPRIPILLLPGVAMRFPKRFGWMVGAVYLVVAGCGPEKPKAGGGAGESDRPKVAFVSNNAAEFWTICEAGARKAAEETKVELTFKRPQNGTPAEQKDIIDDLLAKKIQALSVSVNNAENQTAYLNKIATEIPLICVDNDAADSNRRCYMGTANIAAGRAAGEMVKKALPNGGKVAIFVGNLDAPNAKERRQGVLDVLEGVASKGLRDAPDGKKYGKYELIGSFTDNTDSNKAKDNASDVLTKNQGAADLCLVGLWAPNPPAILAAVKDANRLGKVKIVGFDELEATLEGIKAGHIEATIVQNPYEFGYQSVKLMNEMLKNPKAVKIPESKLIDIPHKVITKDNVNEFHAELNKLLGK